MIELKIPALGEEIHGIVLRPEFTRMRGVIDKATGRYCVAIELIPDPEDPDKDLQPLTIMVPLDGIPSFWGLMRKACAQLYELMTATRS